MQTESSHTSADGPTFTQARGRHSGAELTPLTPAERIALTIALLNRGLDLMDGFARTSLAGCARVASREHHDLDRQRRAHTIT
jgi:hypothetical protein